jgi:hypothetical protein
LATHIPQNGIAARIHASNNTPAANELSSGETASSIFGKDGFTFGDIIDIVNPLQHIPIVNNIYRKITGDVIAPAMEIAGGALFGGPLGAAMSMVTTAFKTQFQSDTKSMDPDSPYIDGDTNKTATALADSISTNNMISADDYISTEKSDIKQPDYENPASNSLSNWVLSSTNISHAGNNHVSINSINNKHTYQPGDGIVNLAYKNTESYTDVITSTNTPKKKVDIIIGSTAGAG